MKLGMDVFQLSAFCEGILKTGLYEVSGDPQPTQRDLLNYFRGWAVLLLAVEQELAEQIRQQGAVA